jgi:hypothetical protein
MKRLVDGEVLPIIRFLKEVFSNRNVVNHIYLKCDMNPCGYPIFKELLESVFELSRVSRGMVSEEAKMVKASIQQLLIVIFECGQQVSVACDMT